MKRTTLQRTAAQLNSAKKALSFESPGNSSSESYVPPKKTRTANSNGHTLRKTRNKTTLASSDSEEDSDDTAEISSVKSPPKTRGAKSNALTLKKAGNTSTVLPDTEENSDIATESPNKRKSTVKRKTRGARSNGYTLKKAQYKKISEAYDSENSDNVVEASLVKSGEADIGIIEKVTLKNFMCHSNLEFEFGPHVNFIIGRNGSGKSAILSGIMIALGSRASNTGRSQNLAGYIQTNKQVAFSTVTIRNTGPDAYLPNEYGPRIIVERKIGQDGHSFYKLKAASGKLVSLKKEELNNILDALNIQVENPVSILTQDASKCFLDSKDIRKKYEFFFKATQLEKLKEQYDEAEIKRQQASSTLKNKQSALPNAKIEVQRLEKQMKNIQLLDTQRDRQHALQNELAWAVVIDAERKEDEAKKLVEKFKRELENLQQKITKINENMALFHSNVAELKEQDTTSKTEMDRFRAAHDDVLKSHQDNKRDYGRLQVKHDNFMQKIESINAEKLNVQNTLDELAQRSQEDLNSEKQRREEQLLELEQIGQQLANSCQELGTKLEEQNNMLTQREESISAMGKEIENLENEIRNKKYTITKMTSIISNQEYRFGEKMPQLRKKILADSRKFRKEPIGPIGLFVKIVKAQWSFAVEKCLSHAFLRAFCCDNVADSTTLRTMMKEVLGNNDNPQIIISKFADQVYDVSQNKARSNFETVFDMVTSDNPIVLNCLIDQKNIENVLLIENSSAAVQLMLHSPPHNCICAYTIKGDQIYPDPNYRYYSCKQDSKRNALLQSYGLRDIGDAEQQINSYKQTVTVKVHEKNLELNALQAKKKTVYELQAKQTEIKKKIRENNQRKMDCQNATSNQIDVSAMHAELNNLIDLENKFTTELNHIKKEIKEKTMESHNRKKEVNELNAAIEKQKNIRRKLMHDVEAVEQKRATLIKEKVNFEKRMERDKNSLRDALEHHTDVCRDLKVSKEGAAKLCERISTQTTVEILKSKLKELETVLNEQTLNINTEEIIENYITKQKQLVASEKEIKALKDTIKRLKDMIIIRKKKFDEIRTSMTLRVQYLFQMNLSARSFSGQLKFDHNATTLDVSANPNTTEKLSAKEINPNRKTNSLSGGERSFVTVALLMALSDTSEIPFHILDEYDVFMDNMNKEQSLKMMIEKANEQRNSQFIFLSPLDLPPSAFTNQSLIQIQKMPDPERGAVRPVEEMEED